MRRRQPAVEPSDQLVPEQLVRCVVEDWITPKEAKELAKRLAGASNADPAPLLVARMVAQQRMRAERDRWCELQGIGREERRRLFNRSSAPTFVDRQLFLEAL